MVVALFTTTFLIGAAWYVFGIGNAVQYRENLQNAADATAFSAAVYDARGMNIIAFLNLLMAAVMAILVAAKCAQLILIGANIISCLCAASVILAPICAPVCAWTSSMEVPCEEFVDETIAQPVLIVEKVLHYTETAIAIVWPWLASGKSTTESLNYQPGVLFGTSMATAQIPMGLNNGGDWANLISGSFSFGGSGGMNFNFFSQFAGKGLDGWFSGRFGLPVENDTLNDLCSMAAADVWDVISLPLQFLTGISWFFQWIIDAVKSAVKWIAGNFAFYFCQDTPDGLWEIAANLVGQGGAPGGLTIINDEVPKRLYSNSTMGDDNFAVWSDVVGNWNDIATNGVQIGGLFGRGGPAMVGAPPPDVALGVAKAEFYYEPKPDTKDEEISTTGLFGVISDNNCMWNMRWRARLRRYREAASNFQFGLTKFVQNLLNGMLQNVMKGLPGMTNNPVLKGILTIMGQNNFGQSPYSNTCNPPSSGNGFPNGPMGWIKIALNPLCAAYAIDSWLLNPQSTGGAGNNGGPAPGIYH